MSRKSGRRSPAVVPNPNPSHEDVLGETEELSPPADPDEDDEDENDPVLGEGRPIPESRAGRTALVEEDPIDEVDDSTEGLSDSEIALQDAQRITTQEYQAARKARQKAILAMQGHGQVNIKEADAAAQDASRQVRENAIAKAGPGLFVKSGVVLHDEHGKRMECPEGMKIPPKMENKIGPKEVRRLILKKVLVRRG